MNATVTVIRHKNVMGQVVPYFKITTEKGDVLIASGETTLKKLEKIQIMPNNNE